MGFDGQYDGECGDADAGLDLPTQDVSLPINKEHAHVSWLKSFFAIFNLCKNMRIHENPSK